MPYEVLPHGMVLTIRSGGGVLRMKHLICPFWPCRACCVWVLEMMGGPARERRGTLVSHMGGCSTRYWWHWAGGC